MGLLAQFFRHKSASHSEHAPAPDPNAPEGGGEVRGVGAIAAAAGVKPSHGLPSEFSLSLGELIARVPGHCVWPGNHDAGRMLRIPADDVAPGLERGKPQISLARLAALAPEVFRWERGASDAPQVRLPIQRLLQQIRSDVFPSARTEIVPTHDGPSGTEPTPLLHAERVHTEPVPAPEIPACPVKLPAPAAPDAMPSVSVSATESPERTRELRPPQDVPISTTLRAVVLGSVATPGPANATTGTGQFLAPRIVPTAPAVQSPVILGPSVVPSAGSATVPRVTPDFPGLQNLFMTGAALDVAALAALAAALPGVHAVVISGACGSATAGDFSHGASEEEMRAAASGPAFTGGATTDTVQRGESDIVIFRHGEICVAALIPAGGFVPGVRERLTRMAGLLAGKPVAP